MVAALPALHGQLGEDGEIQTLLELIGLPYVGTHSHACRVAYDKGTARELLRRAGIPVPDSVGLSAQTFRDIGAAALMEHVMHRLGERVVVKPTRGGSALGISGVDGLAALPSALVETYAYCEDALIERFHDGVDVERGRPRDRRGADLADAGGDRVREGPRVRLQRPLHRRVRLPQPSRPAPRSCSSGSARSPGDAHRVLGLRDVSRSDFIVGDDGSFVLLETAITPGHHRDLGVPLRLHRQRYDAGRGRPRPAGPGRPRRLTGGGPGIRRLDSL